MQVPEGVLRGDLNAALHQLLRLREDDQKLPHQFRPRRPFAHAAVRRGFPASGARLRRSLNGFRRRLSVSCVRLWRGLIARSTFGLAMRTLAANSPVAAVPEVQHPGVAALRTWIAKLLKYKDLFRPFVPLSFLVGSL